MITRFNKVNKWAVEASGLAERTANRSPVQAASTKPFVSTPWSGRRDLGTAELPGAIRPWAKFAFTNGDALGGNWGDSGVHGWVNSSKDG